jgi:hypothetical protein
MRKAIPQTITLLLLLYAAASLIHFVHNAELLRAYPNLPASWSRGDVYLAWVVLTLVGIAGWTLVSRGYQRTGLLFLAGYAALGLDSLGHYLLAPMAAHTVAMNGTILFEVTTAALFLIEVVRQMVRRLFHREHNEHTFAP